MTIMRALPEKKYFKIGEVADLVGVEPHVLRYWETQFSQLRPHKARSGHRLYRRREVETLLVIRELLHVQRFTIAGARQALRQPGGASSLLPRFFDAATPTLVPHDSTNPDGAPVEGATDDDMVPVDAVGISDEDELAAAMAEQGARGAVVEIEVVAQVAPVTAIAVATPPIVAPIAPIAQLAPLRAPPGLSRRQRALLEDALGDARSILAVLARDEAAARRLHA
jgi:DNA-binding transcriptional MerR regulator